MLLCPCKRCWNTALHVQPCGKFGKNGGSPALSNGASWFALLQPESYRESREASPEKRMLLRKGDKHCLGLDKITLVDIKMGPLDV